MSQLRNKQVVRLPETKLSPQEFARHQQLFGGGIDGKKGSPNADLIELIEHVIDEGMDLNNAEYTAREIGKIGDYLHDLAIVTLEAYLNKREELETSIIDHLTGMGYNELKALSKHLEINP